MQLHCRHNNTQCSSFCLAALLLALIPSVSVFAQAAVEPDTAAKKKVAVVSNSPQLEAVFTDGSMLKLKLMDQKLKFQTSYGELLIPVTDIMHSLRD